MLISAILRFGTGEVNTEATSIEFQTRYMFSDSYRYNMHTGSSTRLHSISDTLTGDPFAQTRARRAHGSDMRAKFTVRQSDYS